MDLLSLILTLRPLPPPDPTALIPTWWGRAAHALLLRTVAQVDPTLAQSLHEAPGTSSADEEQPSASENTIRPFTVSTLMGRFPHGTLDTTGSYRLRFTSLQPKLTAILEQAADPGGPLAPGTTVELDHLLFQIEAPGPALENQPPKIDLWAGATTYPELGADLLLAKKAPPRKVSLQFTAPVTFKSGGRHMPIPLPGLVFGSLLERWNAFAPITFPPETKRFAEECLAVSQYKLASRPVPMKRGGLRMGGVGDITYTSVNYDRYWMSVIGTLAKFALYSGVGAGTSMGLGQARGGY